MAEQDGGDASRTRAGDWRDGRTPEQVAQIERTIADVLAHAAPRALRPGEELRWFSSSDKDWRKLAGRGGYEILKDGVVIERVVTVMS
jgi:hypothetical protein